MLPRSVAVLPFHLGWRSLLKCNKTNHACLFTGWTCFAASDDELQLSAARVVANDQVVTSYCFKVLEQCALTAAWQEIKTCSATMGLLSHQVVVKSFALVVKVSDLPETLRKAVCIFLLLLILVTSGKILEHFICFLWSMSSSATAANHQNSIHSHPQSGPEELWSPPDLATVTELLRPVTSHGSLRLSIWYHSGVHPNGTDDSSYGYNQNKLSWGLAAQCVAVCILLSCSHFFYSSYANCNPAWLAMTTQLHW